MPTLMLATKLYSPPPRPGVVSRPRLIGRLTEGLRRKLTLLSAPAGFGKSTLVSEWLTTCGRPAAWLSLDQGDNDPARFLTYLIAALQTLAPALGEHLMGALQTPQPPAPEAVLTTLLNDLAVLPQKFVLVLDDYHVIENKAVEAALTFLLDHLPPQMHLVIATREDPQLPLARLRARDELSELRATDLRFTPSEAATFLTQTMGFHLAEQDITALEARTEGWIAGLQLAAISMQGQPDVSHFITSFTGSHHFIMDYLVEEVLRQQPEHVQQFLLRTSILERMCGPLCEAVTLDAAGSGQATLEYLERSNLFLIPLDTERRWYRYHHLFAELLRQRLSESFASSPGEAARRMNELHLRASQWYEDQHLEIEAFQHAAAAQDVERAERLMDGKGIPLHFRGALAILLEWLESLPVAVLNARPSLWWRYASLLLMNGQTTGVEEKLRAAETALQSNEAEEKSRQLLGRIATARATLALTRYQAETMIAESRRALELLHPNQLASRANAYWTMGYGYLFQGNRSEARQALSQSIALSQTSRNIFTTILAKIGLGNVEEAENHLYLAAETYQRVLQVAGQQPIQIVYEAHHGLARIHYEWNDLDAAEQYGHQSLVLARQYERGIDRFILCEVFLARLKLAKGDEAGAAALLAQASQSARQQHFVHRLPEVAAAQVLLFLRQGNLVAAAHLAETHDLAVSRARVHLAQGNPSEALAVLDRWREQIEARGWADERLRIVVLQALALQAQGNKEQAVQRLLEALELAEPGGFIRLFVDEGQAMERLMSEAAKQVSMPDYIGKVQAAFAAEVHQRADHASLSSSQLLIEPLSPRELEILRLIAQGRSNQEIGEQLFLALDTVKGHNRKIFGKLQVERRTEAVARARELGLL